MQAPEPKKKDKQVTFEKKASTGDALITTGDILEKCPQSPPDESAVGHSLGELFGKQSSPVKAYLCNEKIARRRLRLLTKHKKMIVSLFCVQTTPKTCQEHTSLKG